MFHKTNKPLLLFCLLLGLCLAGGCKAQSSDDNTEPTASPTEALQPENGSGHTTIPYVVRTDTSSLDASYSISENLFGIFLEDINFAVDGGMYAELVKNRSFEYGTAAAQQEKHGWTTTELSGQLSFTIADGSSDGSCLNENNPHYAILTNTLSEAHGIYNRGYLDGLAVTCGTDYFFSVYLKALDGYTGDVFVSINNKDTVYASGTISGLTDEWKKYELVLTPTERSVAAGTVFDSNLHLTLTLSTGSIGVDMVSLMTSDTYQDTVVRKDIGEALEALQPSFLRFPGGCVIEGRDLESMYSWKDSIGNGLTFEVNGTTTVGDVAARPQGRSLWGGTNTHPYYTTYGIGFYEYFELCEALQCMPLPVLNAGMTCPIQSSNYVVYPVTSENFKQCVQDALDLVEFCRGDASTEWGRVRIAMGHEEPFALKYIAIGNEQWQSEYFQHYKEFENAFLAAAEENPELYGGIELIVANGPSSGDTVGWDYVEFRASELTTLVDEHYYESPSFFYSNTHRYDSYDRTLGAKVFLGEFAAKSNTLNAALAEAAYMTGLEKNGDVVELACYAPLFGNMTQNQWTPDLIWFNNQTVYGSVNYYVQQMFSVNRGITELPTTLDISSVSEEFTLSGSVGLATWQTKAAYDNLLVTDNLTGETLYSCTFDDASVLTADGFDIHKGSWAVTDGRLVQSNTAAPNDANTGDAIYIGDSSWSNYTLTVEGEILAGNEGFLLPICVQSEDDNIFWNLGGWGNTVSCLQIVSDGVKSGQITGTIRNVTLKHNQVYKLKVVVEGNHIQCYLNDMKYIDYTEEAPALVYESAVVAENGDLILKLINTSADPVSFATILEDFDVSAYESTAAVTVLAGNSLSESNTFREQDKLVPTETTLTAAKEFTYEAPGYSLSVIRFRKRP